MDMITIPAVNMTPILPEIFLSVLAMALLLINVFRSQQTEVLHRVHQFYRRCGGCCIGWGWVGPVCHELQRVGGA